MNNGKWPKGPWDDEPDDISFELLGFPCRIRRGPVGALCGYIGIPSGHPWHKLGYDDITADVHGGLTFASARLGPAAADDGDLWWIGFDCAHSDDHAPGLARSEWARLGAYRDIRYVKREIRKLAEQAADPDNENAKETE